MKGDYVPNLNEAESRGLSFGSHQDALDFARKSVEDSHRWLLGQKVDFAEDYKKGNIEIVIRVRTGRDTHQFEFVFVAVPFGKIEGNSPSSDNDLVDLDASGSRCIGAEDAVFIGVRQLVQSPEQIIPSFVWLKRAKDRNDIRRNIFAAPLYDSVKLVGTFGEGEIRRFCITDACCGGYGKANLVQRRPEVVDGICSEVHQFFGDWGSKFEFDNLLASVRVALSPMGVRLFVVEGLEDSCKIVDVFLCARSCAWGYGRYQSWPSPIQRKTLNSSVCSAIC